MSDHDEEGPALFTALSVNPQGQLCLTLNRTRVMAMTIDHVITQGPTYGRSNAASSVIEIDVSDWSTERCCVTLIHYLSHGLSTEGQSLRWGVADRSCDHGGHALAVDEIRGTAAVCPTSVGMPLSKLDASEGRSILVLGLLLQLLRFQGHPVSYLTNLPEVSHYLL